MIAQEKSLAVRVTQIGMGGWGLLWGGTVRRSADAELVACVDVNPAALTRAQAKLEIEPERCFTSLEAAFARVECDAVLITTFLPAHVPLALAALAAGKHVLLEKPFAPTLADARRAVDAAAERGKVLMISQNYRFYPAVRTAAALIREGSLGAVGLVSIDFRRYANTAPPEGNRHYALRQPLLLDMAIHHFDLMRMVLGQEPRQVNCHAWNPPWSKFADPAAATATITFDGGAVVSYRGSWVSPGPQTYWAGEWRMECERGEIFWTSRDDKGTGGDRLTLRPARSAARRVTLPELPAIDRAGSLAAFAHAIQSGQEPESSGRANLGSLALAFATIESATAGLPVFVPAI
jgi:predicted dehydrogenase